MRRGHCSDDGLVHRLDAGVHALGNVIHPVADFGLQKLVVERFSQILGRQLSVAENGVDPAVQCRIDAGRIGIKQFKKLWVGRDPAALEQIEGCIGIAKRAFVFLVRHNCPPRPVASRSRRTS